MTAGVTLAASVAGFLMSVQLSSVALATWRLRSSRPSRNAARPRICLIVPVCGLDPFAEETFRSAFLLNYEDYEIIFTVASPDDAAIPLIGAFIARHPERQARLLVGEDRLTTNPKLNNLNKGWVSNDADWVAMVDSNALIPPDYLATLLDASDADAGLVSSPAVGTRSEGFWASTEAAFLNTLQARWQFLADLLGIGFAQGKTMFWRRSTLELRGGLAALGSDLGEDVASTKLVRRSGLKVRLVGTPIEQPIGRRRFADVWARQLRWARVRRLGFFWLYLPEILLGSAVPIAALVYLVSKGVVPSIMLPAYLVVWYGTEWIMARINGWPDRLIDVLAMIMRDAMLPFLYVWSFATNSIQWREHARTAGSFGGALNERPPDVRFVSHRDAD